MSFFTSAHASALSQRSSTLTSVSCPALSATPAISTPSTPLMLAFPALPASATPSSVPISRLSRSRSDFGSVAVATIARGPLPSARASSALRRSACASLRFTEGCAPSAASIIACSHVPRPMRNGPPSRSASFGSLFIVAEAFAPSLSSSTVVKLPRVPTFGRPPRATMIFSAHATKSSRARSPAATSPKSPVSPPSGIASASSLTRASGSNPQTSLMAPIPSIPAPVPLGPASPPKNGCASGDARSASMSIVATRNASRGTAASRSRSLAVDASCGWPA